MTGLGLGQRAMGFGILQYRVYGLAVGFYLSRMFCILFLPGLPGLHGWRSLLNPIIEALASGIGLWGILYHAFSKEPQNATFLLLRPTR